MVVLVRNMTSSRGIAIKSGDDSRMAEQRHPQLQEQRGFVVDVILSAFEPGVNSSALLCLNGTFVLLLCTLAVVTVFVGLNMHIIFLGLLALGLMVGFNWWVRFEL